MLFKPCGSGFHTMWENLNIAQQSVVFNVTE